MAAIPINLTIPANKNQNDAAVLAFVSIYPNDTANPDSRFFQPANPPSRPDDGVDDAAWMKIWLQTQLNDAINSGIEIVDRRDNYQAPVFDPDIVEQR